MEVQPQEKQVHQPYTTSDGIDKIVTLCNGKTMPLAQYRREIQESAQSQPQQQHATSSHSSQNNKPESKIMTILIVHPNGFKSLVKFSAPLEAVVSVATVKTVLERIGVPRRPGQKINIKCMACPTRSYNFLVNVENIQQQPSGRKFVYNVPLKTSNGKLPESTKKRPGFLAICPNCGVCSGDHHRCVRYD